MTAVAPVKTATRTKAVAAKATPITKPVAVASQPERIAPLGLYTIKQGEEWFFLPSETYPYGTAHPLTDAPLGAYRSGLFLYHQSFPFGKRLILKRGVSSR